MPAPSSPPAAPDRLARTARRAQDWRALVAVFWITSMVEGLGVSQVFAFLPSDLRMMGVPEADRLGFVGLFGSLLFIVGAPLVPLWGVWADKYSRKAVIVRSALVEAVVFAGVALSREPWQLALSLLLVGLQLGNTGVMLAAIRDVTPLPRLGTVIGIFGASGPVGFAVGPVLGGWIVDGLGLPLAAIFAASSALSIGTALLVTLGSREVRPEVVPQGRVLDLAYGAVRGALSDSVVRRIFAIFFVAFLANQMARPYVPVLVERIAGQGPGLASAIGFVTGTAVLAGALMSPLGGAIGDRIGFGPVLVAALAAGGVALGIQMIAPALPLLAAGTLAFAACNATVSAMVFGMLATGVPAERRSATLNLAYLPLYAAGIVGPATAGVVASLGGPKAPFALGAAVFGFGALVVALRVRARPVSASAPETGTPRAPAPSPGPER